MEPSPNNLAAVRGNDAWPARDEMSPVQFPVSVYSSHPACASQDCIQDICYTICLASSSNMHATHVTSNHKTINAHILHVLSITFLA